MRAAMLVEYNAPPTLMDIAEPVPQPGHTVLDVVAGAIAPTDLMRAAGTYLKAPLPYVVGGEGIGRRPDGSRVYFGHAVPPFGALAERTLVADAEIWDIPDDLPDGLAVALGMSGTGALVPLELAGIRPGEGVLVLGATGPVGQIGLQVARLLGAGRVVGAARNRDALDRLVVAGIADAVVQIGTQDDTAALRAAADGGFDVVLDCIYGKPAEAAMRATRPGARMMSIGVQAGLAVSLTLGELVMRSHVGVGTGQRPASERRDAYERLVRHALDGHIKADSVIHDLSRVAEAWAAQAAGPHGKILVRVEREGLA